MTGPIECYFTSHKLVFNYTCFYYQVEINMHQNNSIFQITCIVINISVFTVTNY